MRQPQHRNRARTRSRRQPNPANKVYESNGPDGKVRGTPQQIAEKYTQLGRDALAAGDTIKAENYFQHAEHYLRIIAAAQEQIQQRRAQQEQRRAEALARRRGNGSDAPQADDEAATAEPPSAEVVVLPTDAPQPPAEPASAGSNTAETAEDSPQDATWDGAPEFLTRSLDAAPEEAVEAAQSSEQPEVEAAEPRKTIRRRRAPRTRKSNDSASGNADTSEN